jgi:hypothetical protein
MSNTLQAFLARSTTKAAENLAASVERLPDDKRDWCPMGQARTALNQAAECAILNGSTVDLLTHRTWPEDYDFTEYFRRRDELAAQGWDAVKALLEQNTKRAAEKIADLPDEELALEVTMPWGPMTVAQIASYPYWNMSYHEGQVNYIASMLGCLE